MSKLKILCPVPFFGLFVINSLEEEDVTGTSGNKTGLLYQEHGSKINGCDLLFLDFNNFGVIVLLELNSERFSLSIECVNFMLSLVPEALVWEVEW